MAAGPPSGGSRFWSSLQTNLMTFSFTRTILQGSRPEPAPLYLYPLLPAGFPRPFQPAIGSVVDRPWLSATSGTERLPPARVGSPEPPIAGIGKSVVGFATILVSFASLMMVILPGIRLS